MRPKRRVAASARRCHRDLDLRLDAMSEGLRVKKRYYGNIPVLMHPNRVIFALAAGQTWAAVRLPAPGRSAVVPSEWAKRGLPEDWIDIDPWLTDMPLKEGLSRLRGWCRAAYRYAGELRKPL
jgi:hypothetical protein